MAKKTLHKTYKTSAKASSRKINLSNLSASSGGNGSSAHGSPTFCVATRKDGSAFYFEGKTVNDFLPILKNCKYSWINIQVKDVSKNGVEVAKALGFTPALVMNLLKQRMSGYEDNIYELGLLLPAVHVTKLEVHTHHLLVLIRGDRIVTIHEPDITRLMKFSRYAVSFFKKIPSDLKIIDKLSLILFRIIDENNERNFDGIRAIQEQGESISKFLIKPTMTREKLGVDIYRLKRSLIRYLDTLWASLDVVQYLRYGDAEIITDEPGILNKYGILVRNLTRQISISEQMSTVLASGLEVLQGIYNNQLQILNNRLALMVTWLTILGTAVLVPNTIATAFGIPNIADKFNWHIIVWILVVSTAISILVSYLLIRRLKFKAE